jgi:tRNA dimethylallyltransferase
MQCWIWQGIFFSKELVKIGLYGIVPYIMKSIKQPLVVICGPTATGKSALTVELAQLFNGEIISVDSRQVYKGLDIGSAKITKTEMQGIPHHLLDIADPNTTFTVAEFQKMAHSIISNIESRGKLPILCGGTGMYLSSIIDNTQLPQIPPDLELRNELQLLTTDELVKQLAALDPNRITSIDQKNRVRLIRAIEIAKNPQPSTDPSNHQGKHYDLLIIGLTLPKEELVSRIAQRIDVRIPALFDEISNLHNQGISWERLESFGLEYREGSYYVQGKVSLDDFKTTLATKTWQYVRRQMTWFKRDSRIVWLNPLTDRDVIFKKIRNFLK